VRLGPAAQRRIAVVLADVFAEPMDVALAIAAFLDGYLQRVPPRAALGLRAGVWAVTWMPIVLVGVPLPADALSPATRARYLSRWTHSRSYVLREAFYLLKAIALMGWGAQPSVRARLDVGPLAVSHEGSRR
jgi:hypothetical protein